MTVGGVRTTRTHRRPGRRAGRSKTPVVVARATLPAPPPPARPPVETLAEPDAALAAPGSRRDLHAARRLRRRDALLGLGVLAAALGATVAVVDMIH